MKDNKQKLNECVERMNDEHKSSICITYKAKEEVYSIDDQKRNGQILDDGPSPCSEVKAICFKQYWSIQCFSGYAAISWILDVGRIVYNQHNGTNLRYIGKRILAASITVYPARGYQLTE